MISAVQNAIETVRADRNRLVREKVQLIQALKWALNGGSTLRKDAQKILREYDR